MSLMATTNYADNLGKLIVFSSISSLDSAIRHTMKPSK